MTRLPFIRFLAIMFAALFLFAQGSAQAHMAEFGSSHDHDGVACSVSIMGEDETVIPAPLETQTPHIVEAPVIRLEPTKAVAFADAHPCRAPPPRAPPR